MCHPRSAERDFLIEQDEAGLGAAWEKLCDEEGMLRLVDDPEGVKS